MEEQEVNPFTVTVYDYAAQQNPNERWDVCCVCGCSGDCGRFDRLSQGLVLLADQTLGRAAWCATLRCSGEKHSSVMLPVSVLDVPEEEL